jgi:hypothetical protein
MLDKMGIYTKLMIRIDEGDLFCLCPSLAMYVGAGFVLKRDFPEIHKQQPPDYTPLSGPWFPVNAKGMQQRRTILVNAINTLLEIQNGQTVLHH